MQEQKKALEIDIGYLQSKRNEAIMKSLSKDVDEENVYAKEVWNAAIELAAKIVDQCNREGPYEAIFAARRIRELKK